MLRIFFMLVAFNSSVSFAEEFSLRKYMGTWHEIYSIPSRFEKGCFNVTAQYSIKDNARIGIKNTCCEESGKVKKEIEGEGEIKSLKERYLKVYFYRPFGLNIFGGDYRILEYSPDYSWALVGDSRNEYGWILSRENKISDSNLELIKSLLSKHGYQFSRFKKTQVQ